MERWNRNHRPLGLLYIDLDGFKSINDTLGHAAGDEVLKLVGQRLAAEIRAVDTAFRLGGDEFAVLLDEVADQQSARDVAQRLLESLVRPYYVGDDEVRVGASIGLAVLDDALNATDGAGVVERADAAMYEAKRTGKGRVVTHQLDARATAPTTVRPSAAPSRQGG